MTNPNEPVHPTFEEFRTRVPGETIGHFHGLTKREYFAAMAMQGLLANSEAHRPQFEGFQVDGKYKTVPEACLIIVDALIAELNKEVK